MTTATEIVARGAEVLDEHGPHNWHLLITEPVCVTDTTACPLGQVYGDYFSEAASNLRQEHLSQSSGYYGFDGGYLDDDEVDGRFVDGDDLVNKAWEALVNERKGIVTPTEPTFTLSQLRDLHANGKSLAGLLDEHTSKSYTLTDDQVEQICTGMESAYGAWADITHKVKTALGK